MSAQRAAQWVAGLVAVLKMIPRSTSPAQCRWVLSCMAATSERGTTGSLHRSDLRSLLRRANATAGLGATALEQAVQSAIESELNLKLPWGLEVGRRTSGLKVGRRANVAHSLLGVRQVVELLLRLCTSTPQITQLFGRYAVEGRLDMARWLVFFRTEQLQSPQAWSDCTSSESMQLCPRTSSAPNQSACASLSGCIAATFESNLEWSSDNSIGHQARGSVHCGQDEDLVHAQRVFKSITESEGTDLHVDESIDQQQFARQLLSQQNNAVVPAPSLSEVNGFGNPLAFYWCATSHNSCSLPWHSNSRCQHGAFLHRVRVCLSPP